MRALILALILLILPGPAFTAPGICVGPVCADEIHRSEISPSQFSLRLVDQRGQHERLLVDCRDGVLSPSVGPVDRGYARAVAKRACRSAASG
ncbi:hypothetical protein [Cyanobium sp. WAJ14-Wanaka]|uniref:hypothetical protein n=1 Tax=Cyanobium sp. WAJ14-Wanaka TaxID=2823725 RepID=UPI0020CDEDA1|nr:hypothetical protein [Cyanobium sp. WAJ14-Wanaka]MCP9774532.1 hypothetical protein [Cyanobium sp. WAJ14-Wanaka]